jgi:hypothetical protein
VQQEELKRYFNKAAEINHRALPSSASPLPHKASLSPERRTIRREIPAASIRSFPQMVILDRARVTAV